MKQRNTDVSSEPRSGLVSVCNPSFMSPHMMISC